MSTIHGFVIVIHKHLVLVVIIQKIHLISYIMKLKIKVPDKLVLINGTSHKEAIIIRYMQEIIMNLVEYLIMENWELDMMITALLRMNIYGNLNIKVRYLDKDHILK